MNYRYLVKIGVKIKESTVLKLKKIKLVHIITENLFFNDVTTRQLFGLILEWYLIT